jgi:hypothetical protein
MKTAKLKFILNIFCCAIQIKFSIQEQSNFKRSPLFNTKLVQSINKYSPPRILLKPCPNNGSFKCQNFASRICMSCDPNTTFCPCFFTEEIIHVMDQHRISEKALTTTGKAAKFLDSQSHETSWTFAPLTKTTTVGSHEEFLKDSKEELEENQTAASATKENSENHFGLIEGISLTSVVFLVLIVVFLVIALIRNLRKAKHLRKQKENLELDLKLKQINTSMIATTPTSLASSNDLFITNDLQPTFSSPSIPPPAESIIPTAQTNVENTDVTIYLDVDENNVIPSDGLANNQSNDKLPTYNSLYTQLSNSI